MKKNLYTSALVLLGLCSAGMAQTVSTVLVEKYQTFTQTDATTTASTGWGGDIRVEGNGGTTDNLSGLTAPTYTTPVGSGVASGTLTYDSNADRWSVGNTYGSQSALDTAFASGAYTVTVNSATVSLTLSGDTYPTNAPAATVSQGSWSGGVLSIDPTQALTITTNQLLFGGSGGHISINLSGDLQNFTGGYDAFASTGATGSLDVAAATFISGQSYTVKLQFSSLSSQDSTDNPNGAGANSTNAAVYTDTTTFTIMAIPEPSTYALLMGGAALSGVLFVRNRRLRPRK